MFSRSLLQSLPIIFVSQLKWGKNGVSIVFRLIFSFPLQFLSSFSRGFSFLLFKKPDYFLTICCFGRLCIVPIYKVGYTTRTYILFCMPSLRSPLISCYFADYFHFSWLSPIRLFSLVSTVPLFSRYSSSRRWNHAKIRVWCWNKFRPVSLNLFYPRILTESNLKFQVFF